VPQALENIVRTFGGGIFSAEGAQNAALKPPSALENIVCTFGGGNFSAAGAQNAAP